MNDLTITYKGVTTKVSELPKAATQRPSNSKTGTSTMKRYPHLTYKGKTQSVYAWSEELGLRLSMLYSRLDSGWSAEKTLSTPPAIKKPNRVVTYQGKTQSVPKWAKEVGLSRSALGERLARGWSVEDALTLPMGSIRPTGVRPDE